MVELRLKKISKRYMRDGREIHALRELDLTLRPGSFTALIGYSGCGKTTLLRTIAGLETADDGSLTVSPAESLPAVVFQDPRLLPWMTIRKNLRLALREGGRRLCDPREEKKRIMESLRLVGLEDCMDSYPHQLSGGMAQRAALARALCRDAELILMDEPFSALDALTRAGLQGELRRLWEKRGNTILFVTHDIEEALLLSERILIMKDGRLTADLSRSRWSEEEEPAALLRTLMDRD